MRCSNVIEMLLGAIVSGEVIGVVRRTARQGNSVVVVEAPYTRSKT